jgi:hypothetical protein
MPFVHRDEQGNILAIYEEYLEGTEEVAPNDPTLVAFVQKNIPGAGSQNEWVESDLALSRVMEDLIDMLIEKKVIMFTDFPEGAQQKLLSRRGFRKEFSYVENLFGDNENGFDDGDGMF